MNPENISIPDGGGNLEYKIFRQRKHDQMKTPEDVLAGLVQEATGSILIRLERIIAGEVNEVYSVETETGQKVIVRIFHGQKDKFYKEQWAFEQCALAGVPVPQMILIKSIEVGGEPREVCVESVIPGVSLNHELEDKVTGEIPVEKETELVFLLHQVGKILSKIHSISTNGFGRLDRNGNGKFSSVRDLVLGDVYTAKEKILPALSERPDDLPIVLQAFEIIEKESVSLTFSSPCLLHNDFSPSHLFVDQGKISGTIDMENASGGDPVLEFARWDNKVGKVYPLKYLKEGYENQELFLEDFERRLNFWKILNSFTSLGYCLEVKKESGIKKAIKGLRAAIEYFTSGKH
jgi:aminoglycoside phosphotransferase (APT) family kinase protein